MTPLAQSKNLAARMGRWSASHWKTAVFGWLAFVIAAFYIGNMVGTKNVSDSDSNVGESRPRKQFLEPVRVAQRKLSRLIQLFGRGIEFYSRIPEVPQHLHSFREIPHVSG